MFAGVGTGDQIIMGGAAPESTLDNSNLEIQAAFKRLKVNGDR